MTPCALIPRAEEGAVELVVAPVVEQEVCLVSGAALLLGARFPSRLEHKLRPPEQLLLPDRSNA